MRKFQVLLLILVLFIGTFLAWYLRVPEDLQYSTLAESQFLEIDGMKVHYIEEGRGPNLLLVHGFAASTNSWFRMWPLLKDKFHLIALDLPGFGLSDRSRSNLYTLDDQTDRLRQFIELKKIAPVNIVAWSMGAEISLWLAKKHPEYVSKMLLITPALNQDIVSVPIRIAEWTAPLLAHWIVTPQMVKLTFDRVFETDFENKENFARLAYYPFHRSPDAYYSLIAALKLIADTRSPAGFADVTTPFRLLLSEKDKVIPLKLYDDFKKMYPLVGIDVHPTGGHGLMIDEPEWVTSKCFEFFAEDLK